jgi:Tfp pilus assembly protein PilE
VRWEAAERDVLKTLWHMHFRPPSARRVRDGFTIVEVLVSALLILTGLASIMAMNAKSIHTLRSTQQALASSLMLQQRVETIRRKVWPEISNATALAALMQAPTESEKELSALGLTESVKVTVPEVSAEGFVEGPRSFSVRRQRGVARVEVAGDFGQEPTLLFTSMITWQDAHGPHQRQLRTVICRAGLTRSGIFGSELGCRGAGVSSAP